MGTMRTLLIATAAMATVAMAGSASAQTGPRWAAAGGTAPHGSMAAAPAPAPHPVPMQVPAAHPAPPPPPHAMPATANTQGRQSNPGWHGHSRWGRRDHGRWSGGWNAPGGWAAYREPHRGWRVPGYWTAPDFYIGDYENYGLGAPPAGYGWSRYYDDAVLIDRNGRVRDYDDEVNWDRGPGSYDDGPDGGPLDYDPYTHDYGADHDAAPYPFQRDVLPPPPPPPPPMVERYRADCGCGGGYYAGGWYYPPPTTTVVTVEGRPVTTTRTYTDYVTTWRRGHAPVRSKHTKLLPRSGKLVRR